MGVGVGVVSRLGAAERSEIVHGAGSRRLGHVHRRSAWLHIPDAAVSQDAG